MSRSQFSCGKVFIHLHIFLLIFILHRLKQSCPDLMHLSIKSNIFAPTEDAGGKTPEKMASDFAVPYLGSIPMDPNMLAACERGCSFLDAFPGSAASTAFSSIVEKIVRATLAVDTSSTA